MLLVQDYEAEVGLGGEEGAPGAYDHAELALVDTPPFVEFLAGLQAAVEDGDLAREAGAEALDGLGGKGDLGDEDNAAPPEFQGALQGPEVYLGLAASRYAPEQERFTLPTVHQILQSIFDGFPGILLVFGEVGGGGLFVVPGRQRVTDDTDLAAARHSSLYESLDGCRGYGPFPQFRYGDAFRVFEEGVEEGALIDGVSLEVGEG